MKITLILSKLGWHSDRLINEARKRGISLNVIAGPDDLTENDFEDNFSEVVILRSNPFKNEKDKLLLRSVLEKRLTLNYKRDAEAWSKKYQQERLSRIFPDNVIPTFHFEKIADLKNEIEKGRLSFPFIKKPILGAQGNGISLITDLEEIDKIDSQNLEKFIFQPFIKNSGDYRVLVLGGKALGSIKRVAAPGSFLNNVSQGGTATEVSDEEIRKKIESLSISIASVFGFSFCGIDIIFDDNTGKCYFLEVNSAPEWRGFENVTKVNVARELYLLCERKFEARKKDIFEIVERCYNENFQFLRQHRFHFASRMWFGTSNLTYRKKIDDLGPEYLGVDLGGPERKMENLLKEDFRKNRDIRKYKEREEYLKKYPKLYVFQKAMFFCLFSETVFGRDLKPYFLEIVGKDSLIALVDELKGDRNAVLTLSTMATNFLYLADFCLGGKDFDPSFFLDLCSWAHARKEISSDHILYILSHCIIGESRFYSRKVERGREIYLDMLSFMEEVIDRNYSDVNLDIKFEFLVCAKILGIKSMLEEKILDEAQESLSYADNFIVDVQNKDKDNLKKHNLLVSEHRNVLFLMARYQSLELKK